MEKKKPWAARRDLNAGQNAVAGDQEEGEELKAPDLVSAAKAPTRHMHLNSRKVTQTELHLTTFKLTTLQSKSFQDDW